MKHFIVLPFLVVVSSIFCSANCLAQSNVEAWLDEGLCLNIVGDQDINRVDIVFREETVFTVVARDASTRINVTESEVTFEKVNSIFVDLKGGNDQVLVDGNDVEEDRIPGLTIKTGFGDDLVDLWNFLGSSAIDVTMSGIAEKGSSDNDVFIASGVRSYGPLTLSTGDGSDEITIKAATQDESVFFNNGVHIDSGFLTLSPDVISVQNLASELHLISSEGDDDIEFGNVSTHQPCTIIARGGNDRVTLSEIDGYYLPEGAAFNHVVVNLGSGDNELVASKNPSILWLDVTSLGGRDVVIVEDCEDINQMDVSLGEGNDSLVFSDSLIFRSHFDGGPNRDNLRHHNSIFEGYPEYENWESITNF